RAFLDRQRQFARASLGYLYAVDLSGRAVRIDENNAITPGRNSGQFECAVFRNRYRGRDLAAYFIFRPQASAIRLFPAGKYNSPRKRPATFFVIENAAVKAAKCSDINA